MPRDLPSVLKDRASKSRGRVNIAVCPNERALLSLFLAKLGCVCWRAVTRRDEASGKHVSHCAMTCVCAVLVCDNSQFDPDVLAGHNISGFTLDVLLHRMAQTRVRVSAIIPLARTEPLTSTPHTLCAQLFRSTCGLALVACAATRCQTPLPSLAALAPRSLVSSRLVALFVTPCSGSASGWPRHRSFIASPHVAAAWCCLVFAR